jgi:error-prone DNA polymerase
MVPLVVRSHYSLMRGTASVRRLVRAARRMGYERLALTDTDNLYGLWPFLAACREEGVTPIVGAEVTEPARGRSAVCLVETDEGYRNLCRLLTRRHLTSGGFDLAAALSAHAAGLAVLTADPGLLAGLAVAGVTAAAALRRPLPAGHPLRVAAARSGTPVVAVPDSVCLAADEFALHRILRAIAGNTSLSRLGAADCAPADAWLAPPAAYAERFAALPQALAAAAELARRLQFTGPRFGTVLPPLAGCDGAGAEAILRAEAYAGAHRRYGGELAEAVVDRLEHELALIGSMGFAAYFVIVRDIVRLSPRTCGRGSGAASLVAYCLGITNVCPLKHNLYFERFLNPGRKDPPDIDVDFAWDERDRVLAAVLERHHGHAAMVANHVLFQPRMAVREVANVYGLTAAEIGRVSDRLPWYWRAEEVQADLLDVLRQRPEAKDLELPPPWPEILGFARRLIGTPRHLSVHPGGVVITPRPIDEYVPLERAPKGVPIIQWEKDGAEDAGLVKIDLLGNRSLGVIRDALAELRGNGCGLDESRWEPEEDFATQQAVAQGRTMGCFYIESPAMRLLQQKSRVGDFEHLVIHSSIIRPAANDYIREYIRRLHGGAWTPIHPLLSVVLEETFGIMVYQEDVSRAAVALAGFTHAEADGLRKILSKKDRARQLQDYARRFQAGARARGVAAAQVAAVWDMMMSFDGYSFCKPHSASYARVSFQAAYLKTHHAAEFMAAVVSNQGGFYSAFAYVSEARRLGLTVLPPDVSASRVRWSGCGDSLRVGLLAIKGLAAETQRRIVDGRREPYAGLRDFLDRVRPDEGAARALAHAGALDRLEPGAARAALLWEIARWGRTRSAASAGGRARSLFDEDPRGDAPPPRLPPDDPHERLRREFAVLGFLCDRHPMVLYAEAVRRAGALRAVDLPGRIGRRVRFAGWLISGKLVSTRTGEPMEFLTFEDETGLVETTFFPQAYRRFCHLLDPERPFLLSGTVEADWGAATLTVDRAEPLVNPTQKRA